MKKNVVDKIKNFSLNVSIIYIKYINYAKKDWTINSLLKTL